MTKFKLKISGKNIEILQDGEAIGEGDNYKEVLAYVATLIIKDDIDDYEIWLCEKGEKVRLEEKDFDPKSIVKNSKKIKIEDDNDDDDEDDNKSRRNGIRSRTEEEPKKRFVYTPKNTAEDYVNIGRRFAESFRSKETKEVKEVKEENDSKTQS
jgi:hypothetical protein